MHRSRTVGAVVLVAAALSMGMSTYSGIRTSSYTRCESRVLDQLVAAQTARGQATEERDAAWDEFVDSSLQAKTPEEKKAALDRWLAARQMLRDTRRDHPLPPPPRERCR